MTEYYLIVKYTILNLYLLEITQLKVKKFPIISHYGIMVLKKGDNMNKEKLGLEIKKWRKHRKLTQIELAKNICHQSEISRIESGEFFPGIDVLLLISNKLQVPIDYFLKVLIHDDLEHVNKIKNKALTLSRNKDYKKLYEFVSYYLEDIKVGHPELQKFLCWQYYVAAYSLRKIDYSYCVTELSLILSQENFGLDIYLDLNIKNSLATIHAENGEYAKSINLFTEILDEKSDSEKVEHLKIKVLYNYGKLLFIKKEYHSSLQKTNHAIELSCKLADMSLLGQLHFQKASILEELNGSFQEISALYKKALFFVELLNLELYINILKEKKGKFLMDEPIS